MKIYIADRQSGKTTMLIKESAKTGATIAVANYRMVDYVFWMAKRMGLIIPKPVIYDETMRNYRDYGEKRYLVDELQIMLSQLNIDICTLDEASTIRMNCSTEDKNGNLLREMKKIFDPSERTDDVSRSIRDIVAKLNKKEDTNRVFKVSFVDSCHIYTFNDIRTLEDVAIGHTDDETEGKRLATVAGNMKIGDFYQTKFCSIYCDTNETNSTASQ